MAVVNDTYTDTASTAITSHTADSGHTYFNHTSYAGGAGKIVISSTNTIRMVGASPVTAAVIVSNTPTQPLTNEYDVEWDYVVKSNTGSSGALVQYSTVADSGYIVRVSNTSWSIIRNDAGVTTTLDSDATNLTPAVTTYHMLLQVRNTGLTWKRDGVQIATTPDTTYLSGRIGVRFVNTIMTDTTGIHMDNLLVSDTAAALAAQNSFMMMGAR